MKKNLSLFLFFVMLNALIINCVEENKSHNKNTSNSLKKKKKLRKSGSEAAAEASGPANTLDPNIDGLGANVAKKGDAEAARKKLVIDQPPFTVSECNQMLTFEAEYITDLRDYRKRDKAFFIINVFSIMVLKEKDATKLIHSANFATMKYMTKALPGAKGCLVIDGGSVTSDITCCFKDLSHTQSVLDALNSFSKCRLGDNLLPIPEEKLKKLRKVCKESDKKKDPVADYEMNLDVRTGNKWDADRAKYFQPLKISVPGTPLPKEPEAK